MSTLPGRDRHLHWPGDHQRREAHNNADAAVGGECLLATHQQHAWYLLRNDAKRFYCSLYLLRVTDTNCMWWSVSRGSIYMLQYQACMHMQTSVC